MKQLPAEKWASDVTAAIAALDGLEMDGRLRATLNRACAEALVEATDRIMLAYENRHVGDKWTATDLELLQGVLSERPACISWAEEEMILAELTQKLGRPKKMIKKKAIELGHGRKVDYCINNRNA